MRVRSNGVRARAKQTFIETGLHIDKSSLDLTDELLSVRKHH